MADTREPHATFSITSGCLCYGALHNIWHGASAPIQGFSSIRPRVRRTVNTHKLDFNITAQNGTWNVFQLINLKGEDLCGYFVAHADVDPDQEIDKILRVSGSPYEFDSGSHINNELTEAEGIFVINRYDWGFYEGRHHDEIGDGVHEGDHDMLANSNSTGLVDYEQAKLQVQEWKEQRPSERIQAKAGFWMYVPDAEYMFGRFGFDDAHAAARSFLFFNASTDFTGTAFAGSQQTLRKYETHEERFQRRLRDGYDFSGLNLLLELAAPPADPTSMILRPPQPPDSELFGPYNSHYYIFRAEEFASLVNLINGIGAPLAEMLRKAGVKDLEEYERSRKRARFVEPWEDRVYHLLNEVVLSYLERAVLPAITDGSDLLTVGETLFPDHANTSKVSLDKVLHPRFIQTHAKAIPEFDAEVVGEKMRRFLQSLAGSDPMAIDDELIAGLVHAMAILVSEVVELAERCSIDSYRSAIVPSDVRTSIYMDREILTKLGYSRVYWRGGE